VQRPTIDFNSEAYGFANVLCKRNRLNQINIIKSTGYKVFNSIDIQVIMTLEEKLGFMNKSLKNLYQSHVSFRQRVFDKNKLSEPSRVKSKIFYEKSFVSRTMLIT